ncbi:hypothetical protein PPACK8108_LOCUS921 [Phakopsora pachyrhizi]|uniref:Secreted protein n=1 Tax=Phakopsora pachyrhizi TaxID=170000 RepID=A0AAV0AFY5_PHAPC|nr:hypothetical protein PPACK8108_LOCUS921 [Phakopsora pachyrhizi]
MHRLALAFLLSIGIRNVCGHAVLLVMYGETNGLTSRGFGSREGAPRNISTRDPAQLDSAIIREFEIKDGSASTCGRTILDGKINIHSAMDIAEDSGIADVGPEGKIRLILHQVDKDGAGPFVCGVDTDARGENFQMIPVTLNVPGENGRSTTTATDFALEAQLPKDMKCKGGSDRHSCILRCTNGSPSGPYGGCLAFTQFQGLFNDPAPAGAGPSPTFQLDKITENPVDRKANTFDNARDKMPASAMILEGSPNPPPAAKAKGKAKRRSLRRSSISGSDHSKIFLKKREVKANVASSVKLPGHVETHMPTEEGIMFEITTAIIGQADVPPNHRKTVIGQNI